MDMKISLLNNSGDSINSFTVRNLESDDVKMLYMLSQMAENDEESVKGQAREFVERLKGMMQKEMLRHGWVLTK